MKATFSQATALMEMYIKAKIVPMLHGSPGIGKSQCVYALAKKYGLKVIDLRLSQCDPTDLSGFPNLSGKRATLLPFDTFPLEGDPIPAGYNGWILFLDEANSAPQAVQAASYKLTLDRMVGQAKLHSNVVIVAAGNLETDGAIVQEMSSALQSRMAHIELVVDTDEWLDWAASEQFDPRITSYMPAFPGALHNFKADHTDHTYECPRTWEFTNRLIKGLPESSPIFLPIVSGVISDGAATQFKTYCDLYREIPNIAQLTTNPKGILMPEAPSILWALTGAISNAAKESNCDRLMEFVDRMPMEFQVMTVKQTNKRTPALKEHPAIVKWYATSGLQIH